MIYNAGCFPGNTFVWGFYGSNDNSNVRVVFMRNITLVATNDVSSNTNYSPRCDTSGSFWHGKGTRQAHMEPFKMIDDLIGEFQAQDANQY
jgi:hypothetical protein